MLEATLFCLVAICALGGYSISYLHSYLAYLRTMDSYTRDNNIILSHIANAISQLHGELLMVHKAVEDAGMQKPGIYTTVDGDGNNLPFPMPLVNNRV